jgi:glycosyltransferase involved in cell wall biosynthesis
MLKVSCLCPTYNRAPNALTLLEEAIESFLRQDYPSKELIVFNDTPGQTLLFDHPEVSIVNTPFRCANLGEKRNLLAAMASGELICIWDDDDISLPWRLSKSVQLLGDAEYYNPQAYWYLGHDGTGHITGDLSYNASIYHKSTFEELGGHPPITVFEDREMDARLRTRKAVIGPPLPEAETFYLYRWGSSPVHVSYGYTDTMYETIGQRPIQQGEFVLDPHWEQDYTALIRTFISTRKLGPVSGSS